MTYSYQLGARVLLRRGENPLVSFTFRAMLPDDNLRSPFTSFETDALGDVSDAVTKVRAILEDLYHPVAVIPSPKARGASYFNLVTTGCVEFDGGKSDAIAYAECVSGQVAYACRNGHLPFHKTPIQVEKWSHD